jgi:hypothetical protein
MQGLSLQGNRQFNYPSGHHSATDPHSSNTLSHSGYLGTQHNNAQANQGRQSHQSQQGQPGQQNRKNQEDQPAVGPSVEDLMKKVAEMMKDQFDLKPKGHVVMYRPYPEWYKIVPLPTCYRIPDFTKFTGQDRTTTIEHISRYIAQLGAASAEEAHMVRFFSLSLFGLVFTWFSPLPAGSISGWSDLEGKFHAYFYTETWEKKITDLTGMRQKNNKIGLQFLQRFKETRNLCYSLVLADSQLAGLAAQGLSFDRDKFGGQEFENLGFLTQRVASIENQIQASR